MELLILHQSVVELWCAVEFKEVFVSFVLVIIINKTERVCV
jgi:hypothetical protein